MARYRKHIVTRGDTIQSIANRYTGDIGFWRELVAYNNLKHPYLVDSTEEKLKNPDYLLTIGDTMIIPIEQSILDHNPNRMNLGDRDKIMEMSLGTDLSGIGGDKVYQQHGTRDEVFELSANGKGDIALARGVDNVKQALIARLLTSKGSLTNHPNYGSELETLIGSPVTTMTMKLVNDEILRTLKKDGRVARVDMIESNIDGEVYFGEFEVYIPSIDELFTLTIAEYERGIRIT